MKKKLYILGSSSLLCFLLIALVIFLQGSIFPTKALAQSACRPVDYFLILDNSGTMQDTSGTTSKEDASINALENYVNAVSLNPTNRLSFVTFSPSAVLNTALTTDYTGIKSDIDNTFGNYDYKKCTQCGIDKAEKQAEDNGLPSNLKIAVLITDGESNWTENSFDPDPLNTALGNQAAIQSAIDAHGFSGMIFNTIGVDTPGSPSANFSFLKQIAKDTGGQYYNATSGDQINLLTGQIANATYCQPPPATYNIVNLNFGITNLFPWYQSTCGDIRVDNGIDDHLPAGKTAITTNATCTNQALGYTGDTPPKLGQGTISLSGQTIGGNSYPELFTRSQLETSYSSLLAKAQSASLTPTNLSTVCILSNCTLPNNLAHGIYVANGNVTLNAYNFNNLANYVFLINGDLTVNGNITVPNGSTALFSTAKNIVVDASVGSAPGSSTTSLEGWYIAGQSFIVNTAGNCNDLQLNVAGSVIVNAQNSGGRFLNNRDLCANDATYPTISFSQRIDMILNAPQFLKKQQTISQELAP
jgi:hypothetical protein